MKHKHYDKIVAKAANVNLVIFAREGDRGDGKWYELPCMPRWGDENYFLCHPKHNENGQCLHWLNGANAEENYLGKWNSIEPHSWHEQSVFNFDDGYKIRIKPRKEKRWIAIDVNRGDVAMCTESSVPDPDYQIIEIEVEV